MVQSEKKLKIKINSLIDRIEDLGQAIQSKTMQIQILQEEIKILQEQENYSGAQTIPLNQEEESRMFVVMRDFCIIARMIIENEDYIKYSYATKNSVSFYKIEQGVFDDYICRYAQLDLKAFLNFCIDLTLIKSEKNRRCVYNSGELRVYYVSKIFMECAARKDDDLEIITDD